MFTTARSFLTSAIALLASSAMAGENRFILVNQSDWNAHRGFYLNIENRGLDGTSLSVGSAKVILGVGDGHGWRFLSTGVPFRSNDAEQVRFEITSTEASLFVNGKLIEKSVGGFLPITEKVTLADRPSWARAPADYRIEQGTFTIASSSSQVTGEAQTDSSGILSLFQEPPPKQIPFKVLPGQSLSVTTSFRVLPPAKRPIDGLVDRYGQVGAAQWPEKVRTDGDLSKSASEELRRARNWPRTSSLDLYGGYKSAPWHEKPTGFYRVVERNHVWWLVSPKGNPLFYTGLCTAPALKWDMTRVDGREKLFKELPPKTGNTAALWKDASPWGEGPASYFAPQAWNLVRKFGDAWQQKATKEFSRRVDEWGFSGQGKWGENVPGIPSIAVLQLDTPRIVRHPDVFDEATRAKIRESLAILIKPLKNNPFIVGLSIGNEFDEIVSLDEVRSILKDHPDSPAAKAIGKATAAAALTGDRGLEVARQFYAKSYYGFLYHTVKALDPNHLYMGFWIVPGWWQNDSDWNLLAPYCDVIGYDRYGPSYSGIENLLARFNKPTLVGEFSYPAWYGGTRGYGRYEPANVETDADSGLRYAAWIDAASRDPKCIGATWFQYRDQPISGRGPGKGAEAVLGEHYAFGFVDVTDRPKWPLVTQARQANQRATPTRLTLHGRP